MRQQRLFLPAALLAALALAPALAPAFGPPAGDEVTPAPATAAQAEPQKPGTVETVKRAAEAQGDISPQTLKALEHNPKALEAVGKGGAKAANPLPPQARPDQSPRGGSAKTIYGDIIIHK